MNVTELDRALQDIMDWGQYEASAYRQLVRYGPLEASDVVVRADIPQGRVYDVLNRLHSEGAVVKQGAQPTRYAAQNPRKLIEPQQRQFESKATDAIEGLEPAYEMNLETDQHPAWVTTSISGIATQVRNIFDEVTDRLWLMERSFWFEDDDVNQLQSLADNGVDVRIIGWQARQQLPDFAESFADGTVRQLEQVQTGFYLGDDDRVVMNLDEGQTGIVFRDEGMASIFSERFNNLYNEASEVPPSDA